MANQKHNPSPKVKSTPGPLEETEVIVNDLDEGQAYLKLHSEVMDTAEALRLKNLIAAAPDILKALIFAKDYVRNLQYAGILNTAEGEGMEVIQYFLDTIAKAEGGAE